MAVDGNGNIYVADTHNHRVQIFDSTGTWTKTLGTTGTPGTGNDQFNMPQGVSLDEAGNIYVADAWNHRVQIFDSTGTWTKTLGTTGSYGTGNDQLNNPRDCAVDKDGNIYVADEGNERVQIFDSTGKWIKTLGTSGTHGTGNDQLYNPCDVVLDAAGNIYVADAANHRVQIFDSTGKWTKTLGSAGTPGTGNDQFYTPIGITMDGDGTLYVADTYNSRLRIFYQPATATTGVLVDNTAPSVTCSPDSPASGWFTTDVPVTLSASDNGGSGVDTVRYSLDNAHWNAYTSALTLTAEGTNTVYWNCTDKAGNSATGSRTFSIDRIAPATTAGLAGDRQDGAYTSRVTLTLAAVDATSGVDYTEYRVNGGNWIRYSGPVALDGTSTVHYRSFDLAGNFEAEKTLSFTRVYPPPGTISMDEMYGRSTQTPTNTPLPTIIPTPTGTATPTVTPTPAASATPTEKVTPTPVAAGQTGGSGYLLWLILGLTGLVGIAAGVYVLFFRK